MINVELPRKVTINTNRLAHACMANPSDDSMCALGQALNQAGVPIKSLYGVYGPKQLAQEKGYLCKELLYDPNESGIGKSNKSAIKIWTGSDNRDFNQVREGFADLGIEIEFTE